MNCLWLVLHYNSRVELYMNSLDLYSLLTANLLFFHMRKLRLRQGI